MLAKVARRQTLALPYLPILEELDKIAGDVKFICSIRFANREAGTHWLLNLFLSLAYTLSMAGPHLMCLRLCLTNPKHVG